MSWAGGVFSRTFDWATDKLTTPKITAARHDTNDEELSDGINACVPADGSKAWTGNMNANGKKITGLAAGTNNGDSVRFEQISGLLKADGTVTLTGNLPAGGKKLTGLAPGTADTDSASIVDIATVSLSGWFALTETFTWASAVSVTVANDATTRFSVGDRIRLVNDGLVKYFFVTAVAATTLTLIGSSSGLVNGPITSVNVSRADKPVGFPNYFLWTPTATPAGGGTATLAGTGEGRWTMHGNEVFWTFYDPVVIAGNVTSISLTLPIQSQIAFLYVPCPAVLMAQDVGRAYIESAAPTKVIIARPGGEAISSCTLLASGNYPIASRTGPD